MYASLAQNRNFQRFNNTAGFSKLISGMIRNRIVLLNSDSVDAYVYIALNHTI